MVAMEGKGACKYDPKALVSALLAVAKVEDMTRDFYARLSRCIRDSTGRILADSLSRDEGEHLRALSEQVERLSAGLDVKGIGPSAELLGTMPSTLFPLPEGGACLAAKDEIKVMEMAVDVEARKGEMFAEVAGRTDDCQLKEVLADMQAKNAKHQEILRENLFYLRRGGAWYGYEPILDG